MYVGHQNWYSPSSNFLFAGYHTFLSNIHSLVEPKSYKDALLDPNWRMPIKEGLNTLQKVGTWELVSLPAGKHVIGCKWIFKIKTHSDGTLEWYKAYLVAKGYSQEHGVDYDETFAPVTQMKTIRTIILIASVRKWHLFQMDVKNAFLNGELVE